ncbi:MAG: Arm DNA-binding domain-containing protein [Henriciella sp.]|jgi:hypothetical protein
MSRNTSINRLSNRTIEKALKAGSAENLPDGGGLSLSVRSATSASWVYKYTYEGSPREVGVGSFKKVSLQKARQKVAEYRSMLGENPPRDPKIVKRNERAARQKDRERKIVTLRDMMERYIARVDINWKDHKNALKWRQTFSKDAASILDKSVSEITTEDV